MPNLKAIAQLLSKIRWGGLFCPPRLNYGHTDTPVKLGLTQVNSWADTGMFLHRSSLLSRSFSDIIVLSAP